jgi:hypothetical protein
MIHDYNRVPMRMPFGGVHPTGPKQAEFVLECLQPTMTGLESPSLVNSPRTVLISFPPVNLNPAFCAHPRYGGKSHGELVSVALIYCGRPTQTPPCETNLSPMPKRNLQVNKCLGSTPVAGICSDCKKQFIVPMPSLRKATDAQAYLQEQFDRHRCSHSD